MSDFQHDFDEVKRLSAARCLLIWIALSVFCWSWVAGFAYLIF